MATMSVKCAVRLRNFYIADIMNKEDSFMKFRPVHENYNVRDLARSIDLYGKALGLKEVRRINADDGSFIIVYLQSEDGGFQLELTHLRDFDRKYDLGDNEFHLAFRTDDFEKAHALHRDMGCICYENAEMGIYFISDPDGYWLEIVP